MYVWEEMREENPKDFDWQSLVFPYLYHLLAWTVSAVVAKLE